MSKYCFDRISAQDFESMAQALLEKDRRGEGILIQFGDGPDGAREATWKQPPTHPKYTRPTNADTDVPKEWVYQVKYHDVGQRGWQAARQAVIDDLERELEKVVNKYKVPCHAYVLITNVPLTGARNVGSRDRASEVARQWQDRMPEIYVWDAADLSRLLDANEDIRTAYLDLILTGDLLKAMFRSATFRDDRVKSTWRAYLEYVVEREQSARAEEAGDDRSLPLAKVFVDLLLKPHRETTHESVHLVLDELVKAAPGDKPGSHVLPKTLDQSRASFALILADHPTLMLLGGPGLGKSTLTQFLALYQAARVVNRELAGQLVGRLQLSDAVTPTSLDAAYPLRFPFRVELRRYARWMSEQHKQDKQSELARYLVERLVNPNASGDLTTEDLFALTQSDPVLLALDGLDEVPNLETRRQILENLRIFLRRVRAEQGNIQLILSSRPKGYSGEFEEFRPLSWEINELEQEDFYEYCNNWLEQRIRDADDREEAGERIERGMKSEAVQRLARSLLQATVMLAIVRNKEEIPHELNNLYRKYVEVIFNREKEKCKRRLKSAALGR